ncbi:hypothetical protein EDC96DRAFT_487654 [Choanephora cucurbitarum]|nr:hypothetical protein EDC96DRAFT_487654 [Choanephora cucurbitarum]
MFVGDRGYGFGLFIRIHIYLGDSWKAKNHSHYISVRTSNEHNMCQICVFCFQNISCPLGIVEKDGKESLKTIHGTSVYIDTTCALRLAKQSHKPRDSLAALVTSISGASRLIDSMIIKVFDSSL